MLLDLKKTLLMLFMILDLPIYGWILPNVKIKDVKTTNNMIVLNLVLILN